MSKHICQHCILIVTILFATSQASATSRIFNPPTILSKAYANSDVVLLVKWVDGSWKQKREIDLWEAATSKPLGTTTFEVIQVGKQLKGKPPIKKKQRITLQYSYRGTTGDIYLLKGNYNQKLAWVPQEISQPAFRYMMQTPRGEDFRQDQLLYFLKHLESNDPYIVHDAYEELFYADFEKIIAIADAIPRTKLLQLVTNKKNPPEHVDYYGLYPMMLGLCENKEDIPLFEKLISEQLKSKSEPEEIEGIISGYLWLTGTKGLADIEKNILFNKDCSNSLVSDALQALRFIRCYRKDHFPQDRLLKIMQSMLDRPEHVYAAINILSYWKDWSVQDKIAKLYGAEYFKGYRKKTIINYFLTCLQDLPIDTRQPEPKHITEAKKHLRALEKIDPATFKIARKESPIYFSFLD